MSDNEYVIPLPTKAGQVHRIGQLVASSLAFTAAQIIHQHKGLVLLVTQDMQQSERLFHEITTFTTKPITQLPDWEILPYDNFSPHQEIISNRLATLFTLPQCQQGALILPIHTLMQKLCPHSFIMEQVLILKKGMRLSREQLRNQLEQNGYRSVDQVIAHGEFATRGAVFDLFPMGSHLPFRLDFFDDELDSIRTFDVDTQRSLDILTEVKLLPAHEFPTDKDAIDQFRTQWRERFDIRREPDCLYQQITKQILPSGIEFWIPLFFNQPLVSLFSYLPQQTLVVTINQLDKDAEQFWQDIEHRYESRRHDTLRPLLAPQELWLRTEQTFSGFKLFPRIELNHRAIPETKNTHFNLSFESLPNLAVDHKNTSWHLLQQFVNFRQEAIIFIAESEGRKEILHNMLKAENISLQPISDLSDVQYGGRHIMFGELEQGFIDVAQHRIFITELDLTGEFTPKTKRKDGIRNTINTENLVRSLAELHLGQPVVHLQHGVGRYGGLITLENGGLPSEYMILLYANEAKLYVPISSLNMISRYLGGSEENAPLNKLGSDAWSKARQKVAEQVRDVAAELLDIYAQREAKKGYRFEIDLDLYQQFSQSFTYPLTADQKQTIDAVLNDMQQPRAMDRLICGDVGFGKTEVAIRAAFIAMMNHKQVALLVPTTLLAQQHYDNFVERFVHWPVKIEMLSRFRSVKEQKTIMQEVTEAKIDILIGTHKLLQNEIKWHDLGLLIVDEEHRFGVRQKERIKALRADIDILTLTATPIPRTLNMAIHGIRDLSVIATPPARRLSVKTFVREYDKLTIREAILREILRGGQVYYLFNDVEQIINTQQILQELVPEANITIAHGQMNERLLERVMNDFHHQRFNVLLCTTIIETGIDVPTANTIIIERADKFGLAQLHQLRGRVGRSHHQAYAYLLTPSPKLMNRDAHKRLNAIASLEDLGAGFALATHDLEIRGAGELLGEEQSGQIMTIGFNLYMELLEHAVRSLKSGKQPSLEELLTNEQTDIELRIPTLIPDNYIPDVNTRLSFYKQIAGAENNQQLNNIQIELIDRFGLLPDAVKFLLITTELRQQAKKLHIKRLELNDKGGFILFSPETDIAIEYLLNLIQSQPLTYRLDGPDKLKIIHKLPEKVERIKFAKALLKRFEQHREKSSTPAKVH